jgi:hypothetical protein
MGISDKKTLERPVTKDELTVINVSQHLPLVLLQTQGKGVKILKDNQQ